MLSGTDIYAVNRSEIGEGLAYTSEENLSLSRESRLDEMLTWASAKRLDPLEDEAKIALVNYARDCYQFTLATSRDYADLILRTLRARATGSFD